MWPQAPVSVISITSISLWLWGRGRKLRSRLFFCPGSSAILTHFVGVSCIYSVSETGVASVTPQKSTWLCCREGDACGLVSWGTFVMGPVEGADPPSKSHAASQPPTPPHLCGTPCLCSPGKYRAQVSQNGHSWFWALLKPPSLGQDPIPNATGAGMATLPRPLADLELCALPQSSPKGPRLLCTPDSPRFQMVPTALG